jgi:hypothetical protein
MKVELLDVTIYEDDGWTWRTERIRNPSWDEVEAAIRRLDRFRYPFVWLFQNADVEDVALPEFNVMGGEGEFALEYGPNGTESCYFDPARGDHEIEIWRSDQGAVREAKYCCPSLDAVLRATRYFCEHGRLDPSLSWQSLPE